MNKKPPTAIDKSFNLVSSREKVSSFIADWLIGAAIKSIAIDKISSVSIDNLKLAEKVPEVFKEPELLDWYNVAEDIEKSAVYEGYSGCVARTFGAKTSIEILSESVTYKGSISNVPVGIKLSVNFTDIAQREDNVTDMGDFKIIRDQSRFDVKREQKPVGFFKKAKDILSGK